MNEFKPIVSPYFWENGLTSTHADTIANRVKHFYEAIESELNSINFVGTKFGLIGTAEADYSVETEGRKSCTAEEFISKLETVAQCKSFIAFLREAIKAKDELSKEVQYYVSEELANLERPVPETPIIAEDVIKEMSVKDREHYLSLETHAAVYGKFIHPGNPLDKAIKGIEKAIANPRNVEYNGTNTIIKVHIPTVSVDDANTVYNVLQNMHRNAESELNGIKHMIEERIKADTAEKNEKWMSNLKAYEVQRDILLKKDEEVRNARRKEIQGLKIVVPKQFLELYNLVK